jgi:hypothetical protein
MYPSSPAPSPTTAPRYGEPVRRRRAGAAPHASGSACCSPSPSAAHAAWSNGNYWPPWRPSAPAILWSRAPLLASRPGHRPGPHRGRTGRLRLLPARRGPGRPGLPPAWTPLFARASAVVTDGGILAAHASLVAREYGIPAVIATGDATTRLSDGQQVTVDGRAGTVQPYA